MLVAVGGEGEGVAVLWGAREGSTVTTSTEVEAFDVETESPAQAARAAISRGTRTTPPAGGIEKPIHWRFYRRWELDERRVSSCGVMIIAIIATNWTSRRLWWGPVQFV